MKNLIILMTLLFSLNASAGLGWLLLGAALSESDKKPVPVVKTEFEIKIGQIRSSLPSSCSPNQSIYSSCWKSYNKPVFTFFVDKQSVESITNYYKNLGYKVRAEGSEISFNFEDEYQNYLKHQQVFLSLESIFLLGILSSFVSLFLYLRNQSRKRVKSIKLAYESNKEDLMFWNKTDQEQFEKSLDRLSIPVSWNPIVKDNKLIRISYYNGSTAGVIAQSKSHLAKSFGYLKPKNLGPQKI